MFDAQYFLQSIADFNATYNLERTLAKVTNISEEGFYIDCKLINTNIGSEEYKYIPVLKNKYVNYPILKDDIVILLTLSHLLGNYLETEDLQNPENREAYFALPFTLLKDFKHKNEFSLITPESNYTITCSDNEGIKINDIIALKDTKLEIKDADISIKSNMPIEIGGTDTLGSLLDELVNTLLSATTGPLAPSGTTTSFDPTTITKLTSLISKINLTFK